MPCPPGRRRRAASAVSPSIGKLGGHRRGVRCKKRAAPDKLRCFPPAQLGGAPVHERSVFQSRHGLDVIGLRHSGHQYWNLRPAVLVAESLRRGESTLSDRGALVARTGKRTGRSPKDKFVVREPASESHVHWGEVNVALEPAVFDRLQEKVFRHLAQRDVFVQDLYAGAAPQHRLNVRIITELAWHSLFARQLFVRPPGEATREHQPEFTVVSAPSCLADPAADGVKSEAFVLVNLAKRLVLIGGTQYAGEIKKSIFTIMNYYLPLKGVMPMHCSANIGPREDVALFFGLSGTGKTTLSADPERRLIGDDEHGWSDEGVFNFEGGCYAKCINLSAEFEPQIYNAIRFGSVVENVVLSPIDHSVRYDDGSITENTRCAYPLDFIDNAVEPAVGGHPRNIVFLTCDAFGVLPPIARLSPQQAMYHFLSGYTAKVAGTEAGVTEPQVTFSACFGAPFLVLDPAVYAGLLGRKLAQHDTRAWLLNTGWSGGPYGVGKRMKLPYTRAMIAAALNGDLDRVEYDDDPIFGIAVPRSCPHVPAEVLRPRQTWQDGAAYDAKARELAARFVKNFERFPSAADAVRAAGPRA
ncbi:MAG: phosphoenolpyruvate carboxykinase (ATP) [Phycisphaerae bacterium]|nr:phosphoenolpyruvate carboxykinase (ATP) [Phycisphaerae bacterium]NUQ49837.1 phosphoenolpyruvate carboxykinase (ATP) [Phycisphaerae bacterium]